jgi:hypothetical protein
MEKKEEREISSEGKRVRISGRKKEEMYRKIMRGNEKGRVEVLMPLNMKRF